MGDRCLEDGDIPFFGEIEQLPDELRIVIRLLTKTNPLSTKIRTCSILDFPEWLCKCAENRNLKMEALLLLCQAYCRQSFLITNINEIGKYLEDRIKSSRILLAMYKDL